MPATSYIEVEIEGHLVEVSPSENKTDMTDSVPRFEEA